MVYFECDRRGFYRLRRIDERNLICSAGEKLSLHMPNVSHVVYIIVTNKLATYYEIIHNYTIWEVVDLYDIAMTTLYNRQISIEQKS